MRSNGRGQVHTLEAIIAGLLVLTSIVFVLQMTAVTPLSASTSNQHIENQQQAAAEGVLSMTAESGALERAVLYWNRTGERFHGADEDEYYIQAMSTEFGEVLNRSFGQRGIAYNVNVHYLRNSAPRQQKQEMIYQGAPSDNAVSVSTPLVLTDGSMILDEDMNDDVAVSETSEFYVPADEDGEAGYYNTVRVEVIVWRI